MKSHCSPIDVVKIRGCSYNNLLILIPKIILIVFCSLIHFLHFLKRSLFFSFNLKSFIFNFFSKNEFKFRFFVAI